MDFTAHFEAARDACLRWREWPAHDKHRLPVDELAGPWDGFCWVQDWFDVIAARHPSRPALVIACEGLVVSYGELAGASRDAAVWLSRRGVGVSTVVELRIGDCLDLWVLILALSRLGAFIVQMQPGLSPQERELRPVPGRAFVVTPGEMHSPDGDSTRLPVWDPDRHSSIGVRLPSSMPQWGYFTSGTTGIPKLVVHSRTSYAVGHLSSAAFHQLTPEDRHASLSGPGWAKHAWTSFYVPFAAQAAVVSLANVPVAEVPAVSKERGVTSLCAPPSAWAALARLPPAVWEGTPLRRASAAGEPLSEPTVAHIAERSGLGVRSVFGMTEMTAVLGEREPGSGLTVLPGYEIRPVLEGGRYHLQVAGHCPGLMLGYRFSDGGVQSPDAWFATGDLVRMRIDGSLDIIGRADELLNVNGHLVAPLSVEAEFLSQPGVIDAMASYDAAVGEVVVRVVLARAVDLESVDIPQGVGRVSAVAKLPRTPNGKLRRLQC